MYGGGLDLGLFQDFARFKWHEWFAPLCVVIELIAAMLLITVLLLHLYAACFFVSFVAIII